MAWRSNPSIYEKGCYTQGKPLTWDEHHIWMTSRGRWWKFFIIQVTDERGSRKVGVVNFGQLDNWNPEFNYYVGETTAWRKGIGRKAVELGLGWLRELGYCKTHTTVPNDNESGIAMMKSLGFKNVGPARAGESTWEKYLREDKIDRAGEVTSGRKAI